jgi:hypothetical protein
VAAEIEIVCGKIGRRAIGRARGFGGLQCRLDNPGDADRDLVLQLKHVFKRAVEAVRTEVRAGRGIDQLSRDAHASARLADRAFE